MRSVAAIAVAIFCLTPACAPPGLESAAAEESPFWMTSGFGFRPGHSERVALLFDARSLTRVELLDVITKIGDEEVTIIIDDFGKPFDGTEGDDEVREALTRDNILTIASLVEPFGPKKFRMTHKWNKDGQLIEKGLIDLFHLNQELILEREALAARGILRTPLQHMFFYVDNFAIPKIPNENISVIEGIYQTYRSLSGLGVGYSLGGEMRHRTYGRGPCGGKSDEVCRQEYLQQFANAGDKAIVVRLGADGFGNVSRDMVDDVIADLKDQGLDLVHYGSVRERVVEGEDHMPVTVETSAFANARGQLANRIDTYDVEGDLEGQWRLESTIVGGTAHSLRTVSTRTDELALPDDETSKGLLREAVFIDVDVRCDDIEVELLMDNALIASSHVASGDSAPSRVSDCGATCGDFLYNGTTLSYVGYQRIQGGVQWTIDVTRGETCAAGIEPTATPRLKYLRDPHVRAAQMMGATPITPEEKAKLEDAATAAAGGDPQTVSIPTYYQYAKRLLCSGDAKDDDEKCSAADRVYRLVNFGGGQAVVH